MIVPGESSQLQGATIASLTPEMESRLPRKIKREEAGQEAEQSLVAEVGLEELERIRGYDVV